MTICTFNARTLASEASIEDDDVGQRERRRSPKPVINWDLFTSLAGFWHGVVVDNIGEEHDRFVRHLCDIRKSAEGLRATERGLLCGTLEIIRQRGAARAAGNFQLTSAAETSPIARPRCPPYGAGVEQFLH
ncbi:hypothetical protein ANCCAN_18103 [Ancylostoma caninum]|uniref:Uncharacterized protein n=1 Tax=Ancylostoma caninum TaxID=29170 RepID=A0A368FZ62_ANCCA|nr:hypothetical protein ANCCAN_18103 [Ancylostoma caninum]